jgi:hypothetical protein
MSVTLIGLGFMALFLDEKSRKNQGSPKRAGKAHIG